MVTEIVYCRRMAESQYLSVIRIWAALAWADGVIADSEAAAMRRLIESADLSDAERTSALAWLEEKVELDTAAMASLSEEAKHGIYRAAARLAAVDLEVAEEELDFLGRLQEGLGLDQVTAEELEKGIPALKRS
jgi:uncharacterized membrane protein YebE (DUF533 family)